MLIGVPKEVKSHEYRVGLTPAGVRELTEAGHQVLVEHNAGYEVGLFDADYEKSGAEIKATAAEIFAQAALIIKVKEPQAAERQQLHAQQVLFTYLHLAADRKQTDELLASGATCIAYETVTDAHGGLPLLSPMSEVAGRMAIQAGAHALEKTQGGMGVLLGGVPGVAPAQIVVLGAGVVGLNAARMAKGLGADVTLLDKSLARLRYIDEQFNSHFKTRFATHETVEQLVMNADMVIGAVLLPGAKAPRLIDRALVKKMKQGAVLVDVSIDQGGCFETSRATTHAEPVYSEEGIVHYCVANMPSAVARTSTFALTNATLPFILAIANKGLKQAMQDDKHLLAGLNIYQSKVTHQAVAHAFDYSFVEPETVFS